MELTHALGWLSREALSKDLQCSKRKSVLHGVVLSGVVGWLYRSVFVVMRGVGLGIVELVSDVSVSDVWGWICVS